MMTAERGATAWQGRTPGARIMVCDVNETLLDIGALEPRFKEAFGDGRTLQDWFSTVRFKRVPTAAFYLVSVSVDC